MKVLNLYAGIGGNRKLWGDQHDVTAVEINAEIASVYKDFFPDDKIVVNDAHRYLKDNYDRFDFIWSSPPCPTHSLIRNTAGVGRGQNDLVYPDMKLYEEILFLRQASNVEGVGWDGRFVVENVVPYYKPLVKGVKRNRHMFWSNFEIPRTSMDSHDLINTGTVSDLEDYHGFDLSKYSLVSTSKRKILRNCVHPSLGKHVFDSQFEEQKTLQHLKVKESGGVDDL